MSIIPTLPVILQNGTVADADQVMADFNAIVAAVNTNAAHNGANSDITSLTGLTTPLPISEGGTGAATASGARDNLGITAALAAIITVPIGGTIIWNSVTIPAGGNFAEENGQALSRTAYAALFAIVGTTFGVGDGSTTFNLPDSRGQFDRGWDDGRGLDPARAFGSNQTGALQAHSHSITDPGHLHVLPGNLNGGIAGSAVIGNAGGSTTYNSASATTGVTVNSTGGSETRPTNIARMKIIRIQ